MTEYALHVDYGEATLTKDKDRDFGEKNLLATTGESVFVKFHLSNRLSTKVAEISLNAQDFQLDEKSALRIMDAERMNRVGAASHLEADLGGIHEFGVTIQVTDP